MKRTVAMLIAVLLAVAVALPVMASPYTDLPDVHWALSAVYELSALGIFEGYPDGTFKGPQPATRYELAIVISRLLKYLDQEISARMAALEAKIPSVTATTVVPTPTPVPTPVPVTTIVQVEPDQTILETIIREKIEALLGPKFEDIDEKIAELYAMIQDLKTEFSRELSVLGVRVTALEGELAKIKERLVKAEANINALQLQLDPALVRVTVLESRANAVDRQLEELNLALSQKANAIEAEALKEQILSLHKDNAALAARVAALEGKPEVVIPAMPTIPAAAKPEEVEALKALMLSMERDKAALAARVAILEGKPGVIIPAMPTIPAAAKPEDVEALKALIIGLENENASQAARLAALEGKPGVVIPVMPTIPAAAKPEDVEVLRFLIQVLENDNAAQAARLAALEGKPTVIMPTIPAAAKPEDVEALKALIQGLEYDNASLAARVASLEGKPGVVITTMPTIPASAKPEDVEALRALIFGLQMDNAALVSRLAALEGKPGVVIPAAAKPEEVEALKALILGLERDNAAQAARLAALEGKPGVVITTMPTIPAAAKPEDVEALKALILGLERDNVAQAARLAALEGKPGVVIPAMPTIPAAAKPEEVEALKALILGLHMDNATLAARLAALEGKPEVVIPSMPIIPASAKPEEVEALKALMLSMERDKAALAARVSALEAIKPVVAAPVMYSGVGSEELGQVRFLVLNLETNKVDVLTSKLGALEFKVLALESKLNTVDNRVGNLELKSNELEVEVFMVAKQAGQNATDIIDLYSLSYKNTDDLNFLKADLAAKFADLEARLAAKPETVVSVSGASAESLALLKLDILEAQDDIEKLKAIYVQVGDLTARLDATESKLMLLDEKVAMLNMDLAALESEKVGNALVRIGLLELQTADLYDKYGMLADGLNSVGLDVTRNSEDINDLYIQQNRTNNLLKNLAAADLVLNDRVAAIEVANKISADALAARVTFLEGASAEGASETLRLKNSLMGLIDRVSNLWINKFLLSGSFEVKFTDVAVVMGLAYKDPFDNTSAAILPSNSYYGKLTLKATIKPEPGVEINVGLNAGVDTYGISDVSAMVFNGDLDIKVTSPNGYGQIIGGEQTRPKYLNKYVFSSILFADEAFEGLGGWAKFASGMEGLTLGASAIIAKKGSTTDFRYVWGMAGNVNYADVADLTLYYFAIDDAPNSGDVPGVYNGTEDHIGLSADFKLGDNWAAGAFANLFFNDVNPNPESAITAYIEGKVGIWNMSLGFERVSDAYTPMYAEFVDTDDPDIIENDIMNLTMSNSFEILPNLVFGLDTELNGDDDWANLTHINEAYVKYSFGKADALFNGSLKLYGGRESDIVIGGVWNVPVPDADGLCYAGADLKLKLYIFNAGFSYYTETYDIAGVYAGIINKYTAYLNTELSLIPDILKAKAGWKGVFGDFAGNYHEVYGELNLTTGFAVKWNLAANLGVYFKTTTMFKVYGDAKLTYNLSNTASLYAMAAGEYRNSVSGTKPDGFVLSAGLGYSQKIFSATSLVADFTTKYVKYTFNPGGYSDNLVNTLGIKLSTTF